MKIPKQQHSYLGYNCLFADGVLVLSSLLAEFLLSSDVELLVLSSFLTESSSFIGEKTPYAEPYRAKWLINDEITTYLSRRNKVIFLAPFMYTSNIK